MNGSWLTTGLTILTAFGLGSIISSCITKRYEQRKLLFETKLNKYSNLIQSYQELVGIQVGVIDAKENEALRQKVVACQKQVELIGSDEVIAVSQKFYKEKEGVPISFRDSLVIAMREDLIKYQGWFPCFKAHFKGCVGKKSNENN